MNRSILTILLATGLSAYAGTVFSNGTPTVTGVRDITLFRSADDFTIGAATLSSVRFWISNTNGSLADPATNFSGNITYAIYNNNAGNIGAQIVTGTVTGLTSTATGQVHPGTLAALHSVDFNLLAPLALAAGTYWLEFHEGSSLSENDGTGIGWELSANTGNAHQGFASNGLPVNAVNNELAFQLFNADTSGPSVPEPGSTLLVAAGLAALIVRRMR